MYAKHWAKHKIQIMAGSIFLLLLVAPFPISLLGTGVSHATVLFTPDTYSYTNGQNLPNPPWCGRQCGSDSPIIGQAAASSTCDPAAAAPLAQCLFWNVNQNDVHDLYNELKPNGGIGTPLINGTVLYLAFQMNLTRVPGCNKANRGIECDIFQEGNGVQSGEKGVELRGDSAAAFRWGVSFGQWDSYSANQNHKFTAWISNPSGHFNPSLEHNDVYYQNKNGYSNTNPIQLSYETWYNFVFVIKAQNTTGTGGYVRLYVNGTEIAEYGLTGSTSTGIKTLGSSTDLGWIEFAGTLCQPAYDCPAHKRYYSKITIATAASDVSWAMTDPESGNTVPNPPTNLRVQ
ncbi:MAG: hypothetical protein MPW14_22410 [Candidatus Manganitrophus sp.]|nr:hypothetical protein [Candidatus Manganitrophus sp.]MDC4226054.1 hypothetical protein [Candidatus Manganitrophus sp.]WDT72690.1 MAG: hypothetical protein MPW17_07590 [Candidatus Manganitrophus sp.]WDT75085.1 MAG: hypothetical protein MPW16_17695 [Candidatus Manganitrophus sp.]WDT79843.1 MAG: hypothetical protein MPW14_22410 [Candidatus Manganitrophus sp.]